MSRVKIFPDFLNDVKGQAGKWPGHQWTVHLSLDEHRRVESVHVFCYKQGIEHDPTHLSFHPGPFDDLLVLLEEMIVESAIGEQLELPFDSKGAAKPAGKFKRVSPAVLTDR